MAKKETKKAVEAKQETKAVAAAPRPSLPTMVGASDELKARMQEVKDNLESVETFRLPRIKMTSDGAEIIADEMPVKELEAVILHTKKTNVFYDKPYNPVKPEPPTCFSLDGVKPDSSVAKPQHATCQGCPKAEFGTNAMGKGKACRNLKPIYLLLSENAIMPRQLSISPTSLKAANQYLMDLTERGVSYRKVKTRLEFYKDNARDTYCKVKFRMGEKLAENQAADVEFLRNSWLGVMNNQQIDQNEVDSESAPKPAEPASTVAEGEY